jgi:hypothetical protein
LLFLLEFLLEAGEFGNIVESESSMVIVHDLLSIILKRFIETFRSLEWNALSEDLR